MTKRELMAKALEDQKKKKNPPKPPPAPVKVFKVGEKPPKKQRSKESREARAKTRGRLPERSMFQHVKFGGDRWYGQLMVPLDEKQEQWKTFTHDAPGVFQLLEELDIMYWSWVAENQAAEAKNGPK